MDVFRIAFEDDDNSDLRFGQSVSRAVGGVMGIVRSPARNMGRLCPQAGSVPRLGGSPIGAWTSCRLHGAAPRGGIEPRSRTPVGGGAIARDDPGRQIS